MVSIIKYLTEIGQDDTYVGSQQGLLTGAGKYWTPIRTRADVREARKQATDNANNAAAIKMAKMKTEHSEALKKAAKTVKTELSDDTSGTEAAGHALKQGAESVGDAAGSLGKKAMEFAGDSPVAAGAAAALAAGYALARRKKVQPT